MYIVCFDMESVLTPEIWIEFSRVSGIPELCRTTRDEPDYDKLMRWRLGILKEHGLGIQEVQEVISKIDPLPGARKFLDKLREDIQIVILSDTFEEFAGPLVKKLGMPTILCNSLEIAPDGEILAHKMRISHSKLSAVNAFKSINYNVISVGDSYNDLEMLKASEAGFLFNTTEKMKQDNPELPAFDDFDSLYSAITAVLKG
ncbi:MAG: bifunctional phosphoserine phosphatase/homoserine phosphotransferase ThrH [Eubacteriales bacterium]|nr:bifunctional phosphoserine phosphatase/homoserine phosphotransferase ThrH [Eubacteriales bacterium]